ncbi:hypothetical protein Tco_1103423 [Tanacetum coccineum]
MNLILPVLTNFNPRSFPFDYPPQETDKEILQAREDLMEAIEAFLKEYDHIPPNEKCMTLLLAEERFLKIKQAMEEEQNQPEVMQELLLKLMNDLQVLKGIQQEKEKPAAQSFTPYENFSMINDDEDIKNLRINSLNMAKYKRELSEYINCPSWNRPTFYDNDDDEYTIIYRKPTTITPDLPIEEPDNSLIMGDEHLDTIPSVENLVPILSEFEGISEDACDVPICEDPSTFDALSDHSKILSDSNDDTSSDDENFEDIEYVSLEESPFSFPIPVTDNNSFFEKSDTSFSFSDNSLPEFETFSDHTEETRSDSTTNHANNSLPEYDSFLFLRLKPSRMLTSVVMDDISDNSTNDPLLELPEFESFHFDPSSPRPPPEPPNVEICFNFEPDAPMINNFDELNEDECFDLGEVRLMFFKMLKMTIPSHLSFGLFFRITPTMWILLYFSPPGVKTPFLTSASPLRAGGISSGWNFHDCPDFEATRVHGFVHSYIRVSNPQLHLGNLISYNLID